MLARLLNSILSYTKLGEFLNDRKVLIGAVLTVAAGVLELLEKIAPLFPDAAYLVDAQSNLRAALDAVSSTLETLGFGFLAVGLTHKAAKAKIAKDGPDDR